MLIAVVLEIELLARHIYGYLIVDINLVKLSHFCCVSVEQLDCAFDKFDKILDINSFFIDDVPS